MEIVRIKNNRKCLVTLPPVERTPEEIAKGAKTYAHVPLSPEVNYVDAAYFTEIKKRKDFGHMFSPLPDGLGLEVVEKGEPIVPPGTGASLKDVSVKKAIELIKVAIEPAQLNKWAIGEDREPVLKALVDRAGELGGTDKDKGKA